jgi:hypothetical protein
MKKLFILLILVLSQACGMPECDFRTGGICVVTNGFDIDKEMILFTIEMLEDEMELVYCEKDCKYTTEDQLDFKARLKENDMVVEFIDYITDDESGADENQNRLTAGYYLDPDYIRVVFKETVGYLPLALEGEQNNWEITRLQHECENTYYWLSHELMHFIAHQWLDKGDSSANHTTPDFWLMYADKANQTIEYNVTINITKACGYYYGGEENY